MEQDSRTEKQIPKNLVAKSKKINKVEDQNQEQLMELQTQTINPGEFYPVGKVYPSNTQTVFVEADTMYNGAHRYRMLNSTGMGVDGRPVYLPSFQELQFVMKIDGNDVMVPGLQSEQLMLALIDRHEKLNNRFPSIQNEDAIYHMKKALEAMEARVKDREARGVMGKMEK